MGCKTRAVASTVAAREAHLFAGLMVPGDGARKPKPIHKHELSFHPVRTPLPSRVSRRWRIDVKGEEEEKDRVDCAGIKLKARRGGDVACSTHP